MIATVAEFAARVQQDVDTATATLLLATAEDLIVAEIGVQETWPARVKGVQLDAAARAYVNPAGVSREEFETYSRSGMAAGGVYLTREERIIVRCSVGRGGLLTVPLVRPVDREPMPDPWLGMSGDWP